VLDRSVLTDGGIKGISAFATLGSLALPPLCLLCDRAPSGGCSLCSSCLARTRTCASDSLLEIGPGGVSKVLAAGPYEGVAGDLVRSLKFRKHLAAAAEAARLIERAIRHSLPALLESRPTVVPVPPAPLRWLVRGFDPAEEIAIALSETLDLPYSRALRRRQGPRQTGRGRNERLSRPPSVELAEPLDLSKGPVLLVDDVFTTGATLAACARPLLSGGATGITGVNAVCVARAGLSRPKPQPALHS